MATQDLVGLSVGDDKADALRRAMSANAAIAAATACTAALCEAIALPLWLVLLGAIIFFTQGFRLRDGVVSFVCFAIGALLGAGTQLVIGYLAPDLARGTLPLVMFALTFMLLSFRFIPIFNHLLAYYMGLIAFVASGQPATGSSVALLVAAGALGGALATISRELERRICPIPSVEAGSAEPRQEAGPAGKIAGGEG